LVKTNDKLFHVGLLGSSKEGPKNQKEEKKMRKKEHSKTSKEKNSGVEKKLGGSPRNWGEAL